jgi:hypothetical protein
VLADGAATDAPVSSGCWGREDRERGGGKKNKKRKNGNGPHLSAAHPIFYVSEPNIKWIYPLSRQQKQKMDSSHPTNQS